MFFESNRKYFVDFEKKLHETIESNVKDGRLNFTFDYHVPHDVVLNFLWDKNSNDLLEPKEPIKKAVFDPNMKLTRDALEIFNETAYDFIIMLLNNHNMWEDTDFTIHMELDSSKDNGSLTVKEMASYKLNFFIKKQ